ncbi:MULTISPECIES: hypothetical protein [unclassified Streptomyces]|uniref:hypothetical protein n=1 Tax=unclassified Streptomyces TaxID=2593676 RepID=UPI000DDC241A|nr:MULTISPECIES: hypothetical protein [unclassified Streptomyces]QZZ26563.1 hypothetical protein A7X85_10105 [Streptomyces sp. ST1015]
MTVHAIETYYAGHLFRSRLEARWAVVFDNLGIRWEYEPQGYRVGGQRRAYLPDFHLTGLGWWVEVKGDRQRLDVSLLVDAVHPTLGLGRTDPWHRTNILVLGPVPAHGDAVPAHFSVSRSAALACDGGCPFSGAVFGLHHFAPMADFPEAPPELAARHLNTLLVPAGRPSGRLLDGDLTGAVPVSHVPRMPRLEAAYLLGRTARFEHGQAA